MNTKNTIIIDSAGSMPRNDQRGSSMLEVLVATLILAIIGLTVTLSAISGIRFQKVSEIGNIAMNLAVSKAEELSGVRIDLLTDSYDATESNLLLTGHKISFKRVTDVTVNSDGSRTIAITVSSDSRYLPQPARYTTTFAPWES